MLLTAAETASCQQDVFIWEWLVSTPQEFLASKLSSWVNGFILQNLFFIQSF